MIHGLINLYDQPRTHQEPTNSDSRCSHDLIQDLIPSKGPTECPMIYVKPTLQGYQIHMFHGWIVSVPSSSYQFPLVRACLHSHDSSSSYVKQSFNTISWYFLPYKTLVARSAGLLLVPTCPVSDSRAPNFQSTKIVPHAKGYCAALGFLLGTKKHKKELWHTYPTLLKMSFGDGTRVVLPPQHAVLHSMMEQLQRWGEDISNDGSDAILTSWNLWQIFVHFSVPDKFQNICVCSNSLICSTACKCPSCSIAIWDDISKTSVNLSTQPISTIHCSMPINNAYHNANSGLIISLASSLGSYTTSNGLLQFFW